MSLTKTLVALALASTASARLGKDTFCSKSDERNNKCNCQDLPATSSDQPLETLTSWDVQPEQIITYPCSPAYLGNAAANYMLEQNVQDATTKLGKEIGSVKCGVKCDFDNDALGSSDKGLDDSIFEADNKNSS
jgi:hypothetical protein